MTTRNGVVRESLSSFSSHASCSACCAGVKVKSFPCSDVPSLNGMLLSSAIKVIRGSLTGNLNRYQRDGIVYRLWPKRAYSSSDSTLLSGHFW
jgi:hypothetical protein